MIASGKCPFGASCLSSGAFLLLLCLSRSFLIVLDIILLFILESAFIFLKSESIMFLFQKFHPTSMGEAEKLSNKLLEHSSDAGSEFPDKVLKSRMPSKFHQPVRPT